MADLNPIISSNMDLLARRFEQIAHNLANVNTPGFKRHSSDFLQMLEGQMDDSLGMPSAQVHANKTIDFAQGPISYTGRALDLAIVGPGFLMLETPSGPLYTRNGSLQINQNGQLTDSSGRLVATDAGPITIPAGADLSQLIVSNDGSVSIGSTRLGRIRIVDFADQQQRLVPVGDCCFAAPATVTPIASTSASLKQGFLESSNVKMVNELVDMITVSRLYETNIRFIAAKREASKSIIDVAMG